MLPIKFLTIHCSAMPEGRNATVDEMNAIAQQKFKQRSYHWLVLLDGTKVRNIPDNQRGAHVGGHNTGNIGICYIGGLRRVGGKLVGADTRTEGQKQALRELVAEYKKLYPGIKVRGHRDWSPDLDGDGKIEKHEWLKDCPCFDVATQL
jgi:N-acetylmuramoyl-L-alanine amidase